MPLPRKRVGVVPRTVQRKRQQNKVENEHEHEKHQWKEHETSDLKEIDDDL